MGRRKADGKSETLTQPNSYTITNKNIRCIAFPVVGFPVNVENIVLP